MAFELLVAEARDLPEESIMEVIHFIRVLKMKSNHADGAFPSKDHPVIREAGKYRGQIVMSDDFDEPLNEFGEYM